MSGIWIHTVSTETPATPKAVIASVLLVQHAIHFLHKDIGFRPVCRLLTCASGQEVPECQDSAFW